MANNGKSSGAKWFWFVALLEVVVGGLMHFRHEQADAPQYRTAAVGRGDVTQVVTASSTLNPVVNFQVGSQISGNIVGLYADWNSPVRANQVVAQLDPSVCQSSVHLAEGDLAIRAPQCAAFPTRSTSQLRRSTYA